jgi:uncharacterized protein
LKGILEIMRIRLEDLKAGRLDLKFSEAPASFPVLKEMADTGVCEFLTPLKAALRAQQIGDIVELEGSIATRVRLDCGRCLRSFEMPIASEFALTYSQREPDPGYSGLNPEALELTADDMGLIHYQGEEIDIKNEIQEQAILAFPLRALCRPDCRGLCPRCGADLNAAVCDCDRSSSGGKFDALKKLDLKNG